MYFKAFILSPIYNVLSKIKSGLVKRVEFTTNKIRIAFLTSSFKSFIVCVLLWLSVFMYLALYLKYVPSKEHIRPVYLRFESTDLNEKRSYLKGHVQLTSRQKLLMMGQAYNIQLELEVPESPINKQIGMFMVCADFHAKAGQLLAHSCRSTMLHYKSYFVDTLTTAFYTPAMILGTTEEKQILHVDLVSRYEETEGPFVTDIFIEIQSKELEIYSATLYINADLRGFRYYMYHWPTFSATIGIMINLLIIFITCFLTWYQLIDLEEYRKFTERNNVGLDFDAINHDAGTCRRQLS